MNHLSKSLRTVPFDAVILTFALLGILSWTNRVELFRLDVGWHYEHMIAYGLVGIMMLASTLRFHLNLMEIAIIIVSAASFESLKIFVPFRHPKTSDFFADILGFFMALTIAYAISIFMRIIAYTVKRLREAMISPV